MGRKAFSITPIPVGARRTQPISLPSGPPALEGLSSDLRQADSEDLPFEDGSFDIVYSYGVLHHTPNTEKALSEAYRVLKPGGTALIMLYNLTAWTSWNLWAMHCLLKFRPWKSPRWADYNFLESAGTKAYTEKETAALFTAYSKVEMDTSFLGGDLLHMERSDKCSGLLPKIVFALFPRPLVCAIGPRFGFARNVEAIK
jgi:SAM-dependent methyltransferase